LNPKVLFDENIPHDLRRVLSSLDPVTVQYLGWAGLKDGELLNAAEAYGFDVLVTGDKTVQFEQNMKRRTIAVVALSAPHWPLIKDHVGRITHAIVAARPGTLTGVDCGKFVRRRAPGLGPA
jgi:hypothetical protein